jgi:hypothetical protein
MEHTSDRIREEKIEEWKKFASVLIISILSSSEHFSLTTEKYNPANFAECGELSVDMRRMVSQVSCKRT